MQFLFIRTSTNFVPLSDSTLWRILHSLKPSQRKSLSGLDDITAAGMNGFGMIEEFVSTHKLDKSLLDRLKCAKRYLKAKFQSHCSTESKIRSHNPLFALSTQQEVPHVEISDEICIDCYNLIHVLQLV